MSFFRELQRRNVFKVSAAYLALGWVIIEISGTVVPALHLPEWTLSMLVWLGAIGFPFVVAFAWVFELTPEGLKLERDIDRSQSITEVTGKRLDYLIIGMLAVAMLMFAADRFLYRNEVPAGEAVGAGPARDPTADASADANHAQGALPPQEAAAPAAAISDKSIAVLPFADMSAGKDQEYMSDGIAEELMNLLAQVPELQVIARTSSFAFKGQNVEIPEIARRLNVAHILEGSVRTSGGKVRITAQLVRTTDSVHLWSQSYDRDLSDVFAVQDEIASAVVEQLKIKLLGAAPKAKAVDPAAYALFLQARQLGRQDTAEGHEKAIALYQQALALDAGYAAAWAGLANSYRRQSDLGLRSGEESIGLARDAATKALAIDPESAVAHVELGSIAADYDGDLASAAPHFEHALALAPNDLDILLEASTFAVGLGRVDQAILLDRYAVLHDPINGRGHIALGFDTYFVGQLEEAIASLRTGLSLSPGRVAAQYYLGTALLLKGDPEAALAEMQKEPSDAWRLVGLPMAYHALGKQADSDAALAELIRKFEKDGSYNIAHVLAYRNEPDRAFEFLDKALGYRDPGLTEILVQPLFANIHDDPRWVPFLRKIGRASEQLAAIKFDVKVPQK